MAESDDRVFSEMPNIGDDAIGGVWDHNDDIPRRDPRSNHEAWSGKFFASKDSTLHDLVRAPAYIGDAYGEPSRPDLDDNIVLPGHAYNCKCSLRLVYDIRDVPSRYLSSMGKRAIREGWV